MAPEEPSPTGADLAPFASFPTAGEPGAGAARAAEGLLGSLCPMSMITAETRTDISEWMGDARHHDTRDRVCYRSKAHAGRDRPWGMGTPISRGGSATRSRSTGLSSV